MSTSSYINRVEDRCSLRRRLAACVAVVALLLVALASFNDARADFVSKWVVVDSIGSHNGALVITLSNISTQHLWIEFDVRGAVAANDCSGRVELDPDYAVDFECPQTTTANGETIDLHIRVYDTDMVMLDELRDSIQLTDSLASPIQKPRVGRRGLFWSLGAGMSWTSYTQRVWRVRSTSTLSIVPSRAAAARTVADIGVVDVERMGATINGKIGYGLNDYFIAYLVIDGNLADGIDNVMFGVGGQVYLRRRAPSPYVSIDAGIVEFDTPPHLGFGYGLGVGLEVFSRWSIEASATWRQGNQEAESDSFLSLGPQGADTNSVSYRLTLVYKRY